VVTIKVAHLAVGVDVDGRKHALGLWIAEVEGAKFWHSVLTQLRKPQTVIGAGCATSSSCAATVRMIRRRPGPRPDPCCD
jgi:Transposase, Mutator family